MTSALSVDHFPVAVLPEVAFLGRSNVGKSSVINSLLGTKIAKTSSTPGRTQSINFFEVRWAGKPHPEVVFADLPGYGYARVPKSITAGGSGLLEAYGEKRQGPQPCGGLVRPNGLPAQERQTFAEVFGGTGE